MTQQQLEEAVAEVLCEDVGVIRELGFSLADPLDVAFDPEPRRPWVLDWDSFRPVEWPA